MPDRSTSISLPARAGGEETVEAAAPFTGRPVPTQEAPGNDLPRPIIHNDRARKELGWRPRALRFAIVTVEHVGTPSSGTTPTLPSQGPRLSDCSRSTHIAWERCGGAPQYFDAWLARHGGGPPHPPDLLDCLVAMVASESIGKPPKGGSDEHIEGFVAEHIWHLLTIENALTFGVPVRVDGPDWSVTDSGGDGLAIYRSNGSLVFRLWESKAHTSDGTVREVVNGACRQVDSNALRYLARFSKC